MKLQEIKLSGFKSFVDNTVIEVNGNLIGIVGPNGCGKSNVIDALRWVLGESSARQLRGECMQDVIFNGSTKRKPVSRASVELVFDNSAKTITGLWVTYDEISIKRTITRGGESVYYINNQVVRRKDVTELFLGTGLGSRGYAVIEQGMISRIIEAKPDELRTYLEEVAGVSKYKEKRKETLSKLQDTKENLVRIEYINGELEKQISILTLQANDAHKYQNLQQELKLQQVISNQLKIIKADSILDEVNTNLAIINEQLLKIDDENAINDAKLADILVVKTINETELAILTNDFNQLRTNIARLEERNEHNKSLHNRLVIDKSNLSNELMELNNQIINASQNILELNAQVDNNNLDIEARKLACENNVEYLEQIEVEYQRVNNIVNSWVGEIQNKKHQLDLLNNSFDHKKQQLDKLHSRLKKLEQEKADSILDFNQSYNVIKDEIGELDIELVHLDEELEKAKAVLASLNLDINNLVNNLHEIKSQISAKNSTLATISELLSKENSKTNLIDDIIKNGINLQPLWRNIVVLVGYELAVEVALGELLNSFCIESCQDIKQIPQQLTTLWLKASQKVLPNAINTSSEVNTLDKFVTIKDEQFSQVYHLLSEFIVCDDFECAVSLLANISNNQKIVTKDGHYLCKDYITFNANGAENHVLEYQNRVLTLENQLGTLKNKLTKLEDQLQENKSTFAKYEHNVQRLGNLYNENYKKKYELQLQLTKEEQIYIKNKQYQEKVIQEYNILNNEILHVDSEIEEISLTLEEAGVDLEYLYEKEQLAGLEKKEIDAKYKLSKVAMDELNCQLNQKIIDNQLLIQKINSINLLNKDKEDHIHKIKQKITELENEANSIIVEDNSSELINIEEAIVLKASEIETKNQELIKIAKAIANFRESLTRATQEKERLNVKLNQLNLSKQEQLVLIKTYNDNLAGMQIPELNDNNRECNNINGFGISNLEKSIKNEKRSISAIEEQISLLNKQIAEMGLVNLKAITDLEDYTNKRGEMVLQVADLEEAIATLESAIKKIDVNISTILTNTYDKVNQSFLVYFKTLFGGGSANLELTNKDILQAGMQIFAQPPGKKNSSIQLLSGGEKALTAMSLVFAFFNLNPAPFCLLDEVDAPLDDANISRFCSLVQNLSSKTQFIYISHNRLTMEMADQLIGVTMQEKGVSTTLSVSLVDAVKHAI